MSQTPDSNQTVVDEPFVDEPFVYEIRIAGHLPRGGVPGSRVSPSPRNPMVRHGSAAR